MLKKKAQPSELPSNPIELALQKIKDENTYLKLELSQLVSDLKSLQAQDDDLVHKKRHEVDSEEDDTSSQISTPSLMSSSSYMTTSTSSLDSIQEDQVLKIDDFLTASFFETSSNSITLNTQDSLPKARQVKNENAFEFDFLKQESQHVDVLRNEYDPLVQSQNMDIANEFWAWK